MKSKNNFSSQKCEIIRFAKEGVFKEDVTQLFNNPLICGTAKVDNEDYWVWVGITKRGQKLK